MTEHVLLNVINNSNRKIYTSFTVKTDNGTEFITTDSVNAKYPELVPPVIQAADCNCATGVWKKHTSKDEKDITTCIGIKTPIIVQAEPVEEPGVHKTISDIYFSYTPGFRGGKEGYFSSIQVNKQIDSKYPQYTLNTTNDTSMCKNSDNSSETILFIITISVFIIGIIAGMLNMNNIIPSHRVKIGYFAIICIIVSIILVSVSIMIHKNQQ